MLGVVTNSLSSWLSATSPLKYALMWDIIQRLNSVVAELCSVKKLILFGSLIYLSLDTEPLSIRLSLYLALIAPLKSPPSVFLHNTYAHEHKYTPVFAKGEREGWRETIGKHTTEIGTIYSSEWVLTHDKVPGSWV